MPSHPAFRVPRPPPLVTLPQHNVAMQLMQAAKAVGSMDDISVVVVTFRASEDKGLPGSRGARRNDWKGMGAASVSYGGGGGGEGGGSGTI